MSYLFKFSDTRDHRYCQRYPFLSGDDYDRNRRILAQLPGILLKRCEPSSIRSCREVDWEDFQPESLPAQPGLREKKFAQDFAWKFGALPEAADNILVLGPGESAELALMRKKYPRARIKAIDWSDRSRAQAEELNIRFWQGDVLEGIEHDPDYDLVFSNHVLEHQVDPDLFIARLAEHTAPGGFSVHALPLDGSREFRLLAHTVRTLANPKLSLWFGKNYNLGHPWKACPRDLRETFPARGFSRAEVYLRREHPSTFVAGDLEAFIRTAEKKCALHDIFVFSVYRFLAQVRPLPRRGNKYLFALEEKLAIGNNNIQKKYSPEALVVARK